MSHGLWSGVLGRHGTQTLQSSNVKSLRGTQHQCAHNVVKPTLHVTALHATVSSWNVARFLTQSNTYSCRSKSCNAAPALLSSASQTLPTASTDDMPSTSSTCVEAVSRWADPVTSAALRDAAGRLQVKNLTFQELEQWCVDAGESPKRAMQLWRWMYSDGCWIRDIVDATNCVNGFGAAFVAKFRDEATVDGGLELQEVVKSRDGTRKLLFKLTTGPAQGGTVETVLIPIVRESGARARLTVCVSSQVGCAMNCQFCYTGRMGLMGSLNTAQIVEQLVQARRVLAAESDSTPVTNVVFMGMGEPLHNLPSVRSAAHIMEHPLGLHMSHNKVTVSTVGLVPEMREFLTTSRAQLALSLHATTDEVRDWIVPVNRRYPLSDVLGVLRELVPRNNDDDRHVLIEYTMLHGVNDTLEDATRLVELLRDIECKVNLIVFNPFVGTRFQASKPETVRAFRSVLIQAGRVCTIRDSRGDDEMAACGQLGNPQLSSKHAPILQPPARFEEFLAPSC